MNYDPRFAAVCGDARLPAHRTGRLLEKKIPLQPHKTCKEWDAQTSRELLAAKLAGDQINGVSNRHEPPCQTQTPHIKQSPCAA